ncbi:hypothetical protein LCGC14_0776510 [marine sediment metagenome]|uniref:Uncharacterized protein n=1 Tax=marine sediment metagenome TaxID=412755 RepID=A0A0F9T3S2_9ZZZZ
MASDINLSSSLANNMADEITALVDGGGGANGKIQFRYGSQPAGPDVAATGAEIATLNFAAASFSTSGSGGGNAIGQIQAGNVALHDFTADTGIAGASTACSWARIYDGDDIDVGIIDLSVATSGADINFSGLDNTIFAAGATLDITSLSVTVEDGVA